MGETMMEVAHEVMSNDNDINSEDTRANLIEVLGRRAMRTRRLIYHHSIVATKSWLGLNHHSSASALQQLSSDFRPDF
jgi:hypothetical protein